MGRRINKLSATGVASAKKPGYYADGAGLYLQVSTSQTKSWIFRFSLNGRAREMGLGPLITVTLAEARQKAVECRKLLLDRKDPIEARAAERAQERLEAAKSISFDKCADAYIDAHKAGWRNAKHAAQWKSTLDAYASPVFGALPVASVDTDQVMRCLLPIWSAKTETASRVRQRIEAILDWATSRGLRTGDNPARWKGHLDNLLPHRAKVKKVTHHPALPFKAISAFMSDLKQQDCMAAWALEFLILTAARTGEVINAKWDEVDFDESTWHIPAERMKSGRPHSIPLTKRAKRILSDLSDRRQGEYVFPGNRRKAPLSNMALLALLKRMGRGDLTVHGFRSTFRDWAAEETNYPRDVAEMALAHVINDKTEAAYRRGDLMEKRRAMMNDWAAFCEAKKPNVPKGRKR